MQIRRSAVSRAAGVVVVIVVIVLIAGGAYYFAIQPSATTPASSSTSSTPSSTSPPPSGTSSSSSSASASAVGASPKYNVTWETSVNSYPFPDPSIGSDEPSANLYLNVYDALLSYSSGTPPQLVNDLASNYSVSSNGLQYTFTLKSGVTFHDGTTLTANDVKYTMDRMMTIDQGFSYLWAGVINPGDTQVVNDHTVTFKLEKTFAPFVSTLPWLFIMNSKLVTSHATPTGSYGSNGDYGTTWLNAGNDAGSGPYTISNWTPGVTFNMIRYQKYFQGWKPNQIYMDTYTVVNEEATVKQLFATTPGAFSSEYQSTPFYQWAGQQPGLGLSYSKLEAQPGYILFNTQIAPLNNVHVRMALVDLFNYTDFYTNIRTPLLHDQPLSLGMLPSLYPGYDRSIPNETSANIQAAQAQLTASGLSASQIRPLTCNYINGIDYERLACLQIANNAKQIGLTINTQNLLWENYLNQVGKNTTAPDMTFVFLAGIYLDPDTILYNTFHSSTTHTWSIAPTFLANSTVDSLLDAARGTTNQTLRNQDYTKVQIALSQLVPAIPALQQGVVIAHDSHIQGVNPSVSYTWEGVYNWTWAP